VIIMHHTACHNSARSFGRDHASRRSGMALMLVVMVMAVAAVLGYAMLAASEMQTQAAKNSDASLSADALAESGIEQALYYLQFPENAPALQPGFDYYRGGTNLSLGASVPGTYDVSVVDQTPATVQTADRTFLITSTGKKVDEDGLTISRKLASRVLVNYAYRHAIGTSNATYVDSGTNAVGNVRCNGTVTVKGPGSISGSVAASSVVLTNAGTVGSTLSAPLSTAAPSSGDINWYGTKSPLTGYRYTTPTGSTGFAQQIFSIASNPTALSTNPGRVFFYSGTAVASASVNFSGTLILPSGNLTIVQDNTLTNVTITPRPGYPALIVSGNVVLDRKLKNFVINGLCWVGGTLQGDTNGSDPDRDRFTINGAFLSPSLIPIDPNYRGYITINYNAANVDCREFSKLGQTPRSITVQSFERSIP
jgi:hypothetical protein